MTFKRGLVFVVLIVLLFAVPGMAFSQIGNGNGGTVTLAECNPDLALSVESTIVCMASSECSSNPNFGNFCVSPVGVANYTLSVMGLKYCYGSSTAGYCLETDLCSASIPCDAGSYCDFSQLYNRFPNTQATSPQFGTCLENVNTGINVGVSLPTPSGSIGDVGLLDSTKGWIEFTTDCPEDNILMGVQGPYGGHSELWTESSYDYKVCLGKNYLSSFQGSGIDSFGSESLAIGSISDGLIPSIFGTGISENTYEGYHGCGESNDHVVGWINDFSNAHFDTLSANPSQDDSDYDVAVCHAMLEGCTTSGNVEGCNSAINEICVFGLTSTTNGHIVPCGSQYAASNVCCMIPQDTLELGGVPGDKCSLDSECDPGEVCTSGSCVEEDDSCVDATDCDPGHACYESECVRSLEIPLCERTSDCDPGEVCNTKELVLYTLVSGGELVEFAGHICKDSTDEGYKAGDCSLDSDCNAGSYCNAAKECVIGTSPECSLDSDCGTDAFCISQQCVSKGPECDLEDDYCPSGQTCVEDGGDPFCIPGEFAGNFGGSGHSCNGIKCDSDQACGWDEGGKLFAPANSIDGFGWDKGASHPRCCHPDTDQARALGAVGVSTDAKGVPVCYTSDFDPATGVPSRMVYGECNDPDGDGVGTRSVKRVGNNGAVIEGSTKSQACSIMPGEEELPAWGIFSMVLTLSLIMGFYMFRANRKV
jgi:hypothetical protein